jgi:hypothetical protein
MTPEDIDLSKKRFIVCIDEIQQNFVFGDQFAGRYTKTVTLSDGSTRTIELVPMIRNGRPRQHHAHAIRGFRLGLLLGFKPRGVQPHDARHSHARRCAVTCTFVRRSPTDCRTSDCGSRKARLPSGV